MINENMDKYMTDLTISFLSSIPLMQTIELNEDAKDYGVTKDNFLSFLIKRFNILFSFKYFFIFNLHPH